LFCSCSSCSSFSSSVSSSLSSLLDDVFSISLVMRDNTFSPCNILSKKSMKEIASQFPFSFWIGRDKVKFSIVVFGPKEFWAWCLSFVLKLFRISLQWSCCCNRIKIGTEEKNSSHKFLDVLTRQLSFCEESDSLNSLICLQAFVYARCIL